MDEKQNLIDCIKEQPGTDIEVAQHLGISVGLLRAMRSGRREISAKTAKRLGYARRVIYERIVETPPPQPADAQAVTRYSACGHIRHVGGPSDTGGDKCHDCTIDDVATSGGKL